jgi:hypothetical protein
MTELKQLDFDGNEHEPPQLPADPLDLPLECDCGREAKQPCEQCGRPLCDVCAEPCDACKRWFCGECECPDCIECGSCGEKMIKKDFEDAGTYGDEHSELEGKRLHGYCYDESRVGATIRYSDQLDQPAARISDTMNETEGEFMLGYVHTDGWRGYYNVSSDTWVQVHDDCALSYSADEKKLAQFDELMRGLLDEQGIRWARVICGTSNVFSAGYELWIPRDHRADYDTLIREAKQAAEKELRDPADFTMTALTGKDPMDCDDEDRLFALVGSMLLAGSR